MQGTKHHLKLTKLPDCYLISTFLWTVRYLTYTAIEKRSLFQLLMHINFLGSSDFSTDSTCRHGVAGNQPCLEKIKELKYATRLPSELCQRGDKSPFRWLVYL